LASERFEVSDQSLDFFMLGVKESRRDFRLPVGTMTQFLKKKPRDWEDGRLA
jgi:hypothetical protein